jgi:hypothetical protein
VKPDVSFTDEAKKTQSFSSFLPFFAALVVPDPLVCLFLLTCKLYSYTQCILNKTITKKTITFKFIVVLLSSCRAPKVVRVEKKLKAKKEKKLSCCDTHDEFISTTPFYCLYSFNLKDNEQQRGTRE